jgi:hypothetical protein
MSDEVVARPVSQLDALFRPRSVAVIGASAGPAPIGRRPIAYMVRRHAGYAAGRPARSPA